MASIGERVAQYGATTKQGLLERMGMAENTVEPTDLRVAARYVDDAVIQMTHVYKRMIRYSKSGQTNIEDGSMLGDALRSYAESEKCDSLRGMLESVANFHCSIEEARAQMFRGVVENVATPLRDFVKCDLKDARDQKKKYDRARLGYEAASSHLKALNKKQKTSVQKILEAEASLGIARETFEDVGEETEFLLNSVREKNEFEMTNRLCVLMGEYHKFFWKGLEWIESLLPVVDQGKARAAELKKSWEEKCEERRVRVAKEKEERRRRRLREFENPLFGVHLDIITAREQSRVPSHISAIIHHIRGHSLSLEGIFRISASRSVMDDITDKLNLGQSVDWADTGDPHVAPCTLKYFLREMPEPLFTNRLFSTWLQLGGYDESDRWIETAANIMQQLPPEHLLLLRMLLRLCHDISNIEDNMMSASALAIVLGPNILTQKDSGQDPTAMVQLMGAANSIVTSLIEEYPRIAELLPGDDPVPEPMNLPPPPSTKAPDPPQAVGADAADFLPSQRAHKVMLMSELQERSAAGESGKPGSARYHRAPTSMQQAGEFHLPPPDEVAPPPPRGPTDDAPFPPGASTPPSGSSPSASPPESTVRLCLPDTEAPSPPDGLTLAEAPERKTVYIPGSPHVTKGSALHRPVKKKLQSPTAAATLRPKRRRSGSLSATDKRFSVDHRLVQESPPRLESPGNRQRRAWAKVSPSKPPDSVVISSPPKPSKWQPAPIAPTKFSTTDTVMRSTSERVSPYGSGGGGSKNGRRDTSLAASTGSVSTKLGDIKSEMKKKHAKTLTPVNSSDGSKRPVSVPHAPALLGAAEGKSSWSSVSRPTSERPPYADVRPVSERGSSEYAPAEKSAGSSDGERPAPSWGVRPSSLDSRTKEESEGGSCGPGQKRPSGRKGGGWRQGVLEFSDDEAE